MARLHMVDPYVNILNHESLSAVFPVCGRIFLRFVWDNSAFAWWSSAPSFGSERSRQTLCWASCKRRSCHRFQCFFLPASPVLMRRVETRGDYYGADIGKQPFRSIHIELHSETLHHSLHTSKLFNEVLLLCSPGWQLTTACNLKEPWI